MPFDRSRSTPLRTPALLLLLAVFAALWFGSLEYRKLIKPDEGRYAEIPREMVVSGDWTTPRLNGIKYFEKPVLQYWATATAFTVFGQHDWTARLWPGLTGFLGVLLIYLTGRRLFGSRAALYAATALASGLLYIFIGHANTLDMSFTFFTSLALCAFLLGQREEPGNRMWRLIVWVALALAVLTKGIVALVLTGATLVVYSLINRDFSPWRRLDVTRGLPLFLLIAAPWFVAVSIANPEFARFFFIHEHFERFLTKVHGRYQPWWYFIPILLLGALPWTFLSLHAAVRSWFVDRSGRFAPRRLLLVWIVVVFGFFSVSSSKLASYILPLYPALALLLGDFLARCERRTLVNHIAPIVIIAAAVMLLLPPYVAKLGDAESTPEMMANYSHWLQISTALWLAGSGAALWLAIRDQRTTAIICMAFGGGLVSLGGLLGHENLAPSNSAYSIARQVKPLLPAGVPFYSVQTYDQTLPYYLDRTVTLVDYRDELSFGIDQEPDKWLPTLAAFKEHWLADKDAFALMTRDNYQKLAAAGDLPMRVVGEDTRRIIVRKP